MDLSCSWKYDKGTLANQAAQGYQVSLSEPPKDPMSKDRDARKARARATAKVFIANI